LYELLANFMYEDYSEFLLASGNGVVSIAGRLNEEILLRAMENSGLRREREMDRTGNRGEGDLLVYSSAPKKPKLCCEVKSYKARERFLRAVGYQAPP
jgi:hypothetical protein